MKILQLKGYELEKSKSNTPEEFFNRSEIVYLDKGEEKTFYVLYLRYFEEKISEITPFESDPIFTIADRDIYFRDIAAFLCFINNPDFKKRRRVYINSLQEFSTYFKNINYEEVKSMFEKIEKQESVELKSSVFLLN
ncbi:hypothetical protein [Bacillus taeanensis]|uniref:Uncharacterized protein n=1 Tax=Bacillus taeanensis TaxID=273032 RepID=A0A366XWS0_9BACI|nr:hypothetical protein [Bacillus taeanensis]RBW70347.1 hypothetical protein DS031_07210 [Bacillus taeanensis]